MAAIGGVPSEHHSRFLSKYTSVRQVIRRISFAFFEFSRERLTEGAGAEVDTVAYQTIATSCAVHNSVQSLDDEI